MIANRTIGLLKIQAALLLLVVPAWFLLNIVVSVEIFHRIQYWQINTHLYLLGIIGARISVFYSRTQSLPRGPRRFQWVAAIRRTNSEVFTLALVLFAIVFAIKDLAISRIFLATFIVDTWILLIILNRYLPGLLARLAFHGPNEARTLLVGSARAAERLEDWIVNQPPIGMRLLGLVSSQADAEYKGTLSHLGETSEFTAIITEQRAHQIILLESRDSMGWVNEVVDTCVRMGCRILMLNPWEEYFQQPLRAVREGRHTFFTVQEEPLENPIGRILKRLLDLAVALPVSFFILPPLCLFVRLAQAKQSPGPMFHRQQRSGFHQGIFTIYKFRTMHAYEKGEKEARQAERDDDRVYPFGRFLRRTSLDEFPQFLNVLIGQMSVVGPRPHLLEHDEAFSKQVRTYHSRHFVKPGITGLAQYRGFRGEITDPSMIRDRVRLDLEYIRNWSIWLDIGIIVMTFVQVLNPPRSAY